ncbi:hypothetical protein [Methylopila sp. M107]|uniref:hypothetical protein n=1 Tax=Methylopila sp. M107 TaxID=1101190 RepID=UPI000360AE98|nr:hypothetical protein [Methylopila sp. M107]
MTRANLASVCAAFALIALAGPAVAESRYCARLSEQDHFSSSGQRLTTVGAVIQQDRANFHRFGRADPEDESDAIFSNKRNRELLNGRVDANALSQAERREIVDGTPYVCVTASDDGAAFITSIR